MGTTSTISVLAPLETRMASVRVWPPLMAVYVVAGIAATAQTVYGAQDVAVDARWRGNALAVSARATLRASISVIWRTLTDYDHLADFIPGMKKSRTLTRQGTTATVEQIGEAQCLIFRYPIAVIVESDEHYPVMIGLRMLTGNLRQLAGAYRIETVHGSRDEFVLQWRGIVEPDIPLPFFITAPGLRDDVEHQFLGMVREIEHRQHAAGQ